MERNEVQAAIDDIREEQDPSLKSQKLAGLCSALFRERGIELVVVGGSAIEFYTDGAYSSGDVDLCVLSPSRPIPLRLRQEIMGELGGQGGPRSWQVAGMFVDLLGNVEKEGRTPIRQLASPYGPINLLDPEELLVERVLVSVYPSANEEARSCARELVVVAVNGAVKMDWKEVVRLAKSPDYRVVDELRTLVQEVCDEFKMPSPCDPDG
jgi:hypothetical protein